MTTDMTDTARTPTTWTLELAYDDAVQIDCEPEGPAGAARLEFEDGSFIEVDPTDLTRVLRICAMHTPTGWWLLRVAVGAEIAEAAESRELPDYGRFTPGDPPAELAILARAALIDHLGTYDRPSRRPIWRVELLATLSAIQAAFSRERAWQLTHAPVGSAPLAASEAAFGVVMRLPADVVPQLGALCRDAERTASAVGYAAAASRFAQVAVAAENLADTRVPIDDLERQLAIADEDDASADTWPSADQDADSYLNDQDDRHGGFEVKCDIDSHMFDSMELGAEGQVTVSVHGAGCIVKVDHVSFTAGQVKQLYLRVFDPDAVGPAASKLLYLAPVDFDASAGVLTARVNLTAAALTRVSGSLLAEFVDSAQPTDFPTRFQYWANLRRANFARLVLALIEHSDHVSPAIQARREAALRASAEADGLDEAAAARTVAERASESGRVGSLRFITPTLVPGT